MSDDFDDIFGDFDPTADLDELDWNNPDGPLPLNKSNTKKDASGATGKGTGLEGVDDEVKIAKRKPRAKLDADRYDTLISDLFRVSILPLCPSGY